MGSIHPQLIYSDGYAFTAGELSGFSPAPVMAEGNGSSTSTTGCAMWGEDNLIIPMIDNGVLDELSPPESDMASPAVGAVPSLYPHDQQAGVLDGPHVVPAAAAFSDYNNNVGGLMHGMQSYGHHAVGYQPADQLTREFGDHDCCGLFMPDFKPFGLVSRDTWVLFYS